MGKITALLCLFLVICQSVNALPVPDDEVAIVGNTSPTESDEDIRRLFSGSDVDFPFDVIEDGSDQSASSSSAYSTWSSSATVTLDGTASGSTVTAKIPSGDYGFTIPTDTPTDTTITDSTTVVPSTTVDGEGGQSGSTIVVATSSAPCTTDAVTDVISTVTKSSTNLVTETIVDSEGQGEGNTVTVSETETPSVTVITESVPSTTTTTITAAVPVSVPVSTVTSTTTPIIIDGEGDSNGVPVVIESSSTALVSIVTSVNTDYGYGVQSTEVPPSGAVTVTRTVYVDDSTATAQSIVLTRSITTTAFTTSITTLTTSCDTRPVNTITVEETSTVPFTTTIVESVTLTETVISPTTVVSTVATTSVSTLTDRTTITESTTEFETTTSTATSTATVTNTETVTSVFTEVTTTTSIVPVSTEVTIVVTATTTATVTDDSIFTQVGTVVVTETVTEEPFESTSTPCSKTITPVPTTTPCDKEIPATGTNASVVVTETPCETEQGVVVGDVVTSAVDIPEFTQVFSDELPPIDVLDDTAIFASVPTTSAPSYEASSSKTYDGEGQVSSTSPTFAY